MTSKFDAAVNKILSEDKLPWYYKAIDKIVPDKWARVDDEGMAGPGAGPAWRGFKKGVGAASYAIPGTGAVKAGVGGYRAIQAARAANATRQARQTQAAIQAANTGQKLKPVTKLGDYKDAAKKGWKAATDTTKGPLGGTRAYAKPKPGEKGFKAWMRRELSKDAGGALNKQYIAAPMATGLGSLAAEPLTPETPGDYVTIQDPAISQALRYSGVEDKIIDPVTGKIIDVAVDNPVTQKAIVPAAKRIRDMIYPTPKKK
jgi:hypothetical protein